jgi:hypothetical protein
MAVNEDSGEFTSSMGLVVHEIIKDRQDEVNAVTGGSLERQLLIRELMMHSYIRGFFDGEARREQH